MQQQSTNQQHTFILNDSPCKIFKSMSSVDKTQKNCQNRQERIVLNKFRSIFKILLNIYDGISCKNCQHFLTVTIFVKKKKKSPSQIFDRIPTTDGAKSSAIFASINQRNCQQRQLLVDYVNLNFFVFKDPLALKNHSFFKRIKIQTRLAIQQCFHFPLPLKLIQ